MGLHGTNPRLLAPVGSTGYLSDVRPEAGVADAGDGLRPESKVDGAVRLDRRSRWIPMLRPERIASVSAYGRWATPGPSLIDNQSVDALHRPGHRQLETGHGIGQRNRRCALGRDGHAAIHGLRDQDEEGVVVVQRPHVGDVRPVGEVPLPTTTHQSIGGGVAAGRTGEGVLR
jgi:hypothetical protein